MSSRPAYSLLRFLPATLLVACNTSSPEPDGPTPVAIADGYAAVAPLVHRSCVPCHRPDGAGPFPLETYADIAGEIGAVREAIASELMPPSALATGLARSRGLSRAERAALLAWLDDGAPRGDGAAAPAPAPAAGWQLGEPDAIATMTQPFLLSEGSDVHTAFVLPLRLPATRWVRAIEVRPSRPLVRHATVLIDTTRSSRWRDRSSPDVGFTPSTGHDPARPPGEAALAWSPGDGPLVATTDRAWRLPSRTDLVAHVYLAGDDRPQLVELEIGLYFADGAPANPPLAVRLGAPLLDVAGDAAATSEDAYTLPVDATLEAVHVDAGPLGTSVALTAELADGEELELLTQPRFDFAWQESHRPVDGVALAAGTRLRARLGYDGSARRLAALSSLLPGATRALDGVAYGEVWLELRAADGAARERLRSDHGAARRAADIAMHESFLASRPGDPVAGDGLAALYLSSGRAGDAARVLGRLLDLHPELVTARDRLGLALLELDRTDDAIAELERVLRIAPHHHETRNNLALALRRKGQLEPAIANLRDYVEARPKVALGHYNLGRLLLEQGELVEAISHLREATELQPEDAAAHYALGAALADARQTSAAKESLARTLELDPTHTTASELLAAVEAMR